MSVENQEGEALYRYTLVNEYKYPAHIFALDYYRPGSQGEDDFSRKEAWFYYLGDQELENEFSDRVEKLLDDLFVNNSIDWSYFTLAPSHQKDSLNENMLKICEKISEKGGLDYRQVLRRSIAVGESSEMGSVRQKIIEQEDSIEVTEDVKGDNIVIIDNISVSGVFLAYCTKMLLEAGAKTVCCVVLGVTNSIREVKRLEKGTTASTAMADLLNDPNKEASDE